MSLMFCQHPYAARREYQGVETCRECGDARSARGFWPSVTRRIHPDRSLRTMAGTVVYRDWYWSRLQ